MKFKVILVVLFSFMLISCGKQDNVVFLNYETGVEEYKFSSEEVLILPNVSKDNFVFIGWTDGENYYAGLTEVDVSGLTLTPEFVAIEEVFTSFYIKNNGVYLGNYIGDSTIVGIPYYWNDYLIVNADSFRNRTDIEKIFLASSVLTIPELKHLESLTDFAFFGDLMGYTEVMLMGEAEFIHMMTDNDCVWGGKDSFDNENPQKYDNCPVISAKRTVGAVIADKTYYNYEVILDINYYGGNSRLSRYNFPSSLKYLILPHSSSNLSGLPRYLYQNHFADMKYIDGLDADLYLENGMFIREQNDELELIFYISEEDVIKIDSDVYTINIGFDTSPNIKEVKVTGNGGYYSIDGIIYKNDSSTNDMTTLIYIPRSYEKNTFTMPDDLLNIYSFYNDKIEVIEFNDVFLYWHLLPSMFANLKSITNFENNPNVYYEDGVFYEDDTKEVIVFVDASVKTLVLNDNVKSVYNYAIKSVEELQLNDSINHLIYQALLNVSNLNKLVVPKTNPYLIYEDNVLYRASDNSVIYNKELADEYYLLAMLNPGYNEEYNIVTTLNNEITKGKIRFILGDPLVFSVPVFINGLEASSFAYTKKLESITLNEYIEVLPRELFSLENLKSITLESSNLVRVESDYDFVENPDFQESMLYILNRGSIEHIYVPRDLLEEYKTDVFWGQFSDIIEPI